MLFLCNFRNVSLIFSLILIFDTVWWRTPKRYWQIINDMNLQRKTTTKIMTLGVLLTCLGGWFLQCYRFVDLVTKSVDFLSPLVTGRGFHILKKNLWIFLWIFRRPPFELQTLMPSVACINLKHAVNKHFGSINLPYIDPIPSNSPLFEPQTLMPSVECINLKHTVNKRTAKISTSGIVIASMLHGYSRHCSTSGFLSNSWTSCIFVCCFILFHCQVTGERFFIFSCLCVVRFSCHSSCVICDHLLVKSLHYGGRLRRASWNFLSSDGHAEKN